MVYTVTNAAINVLCCTRKLLTTIAGLWAVLWGLRLGFYWATQDMKNVVLAVTKLFQCSKVNLLLEQGQVFFMDFSVFDSIHLCLGCDQISCPCHWESLHSTLCYQHASPLGYYYKDLVFTRCDTYCISSAPKHTFCHSTIMTRLMEYFWDGCLFGEDFFGNSVGGNWVVGHFPGWPDLEEVMVSNFFHLTEPYRNVLYTFAQIYVWTQFDGQDLWRISCTWFGLICTVNCGLLYTQLCASPTYVQSNWFAIQ